MGIDSRRPFDALLLSAAAALVIGATLSLLIAAPPAPLPASDRAPGPGEPAWAASLRRVDDALVAKSFADAARDLQQAYLAALGSRRSEGMIEVGDAARRVGRATGAERAYDARARQAYLIALFRARHERSVVGVLRVADAFDALGDAAVAKQCQRVAFGLMPHSRAGGRERSKS